MQGRLSLTTNSRSALTLDYLVLGNDSSQAHAEVADNVNVYVALEGRWWRRRLL